MEIITGLIISLLFQIIDKLKKDPREEVEVSLESIDSFSYALTQFLIWLP
jgi:hypothetical protein